MNYILLAAFVVTDNKHKLTWTEMSALLEGSTNVLTSGGLLESVKFVHEIDVTKTCEGVVGIIYAN